LRSGGVREIKLKELTRHGDVWVDRAGDEFELVFSLPDYLDPAASNVTAFTVSGDRLLCLRPADAVEQVETRSMGTMSGGRA